MGWHPPLRRHFARNRPTRDRAGRQNCLTRKKLTARPVMPPRSDSKPAIEFIANIDVVGKPAIKWALATARRPHCGFAQSAGGLQHPLTPSQGTISMRMKKLGNTGLVVSEICLGTMTFSTGEGFWGSIGNTDQAGATDIVKTALDQGVNFIDTADVYSAGIAETMTGQALKTLGLPRDQFVLATKVLGRMGPGANQSGLSRVHILHAVDASLKRLQLDHIDLYQIHGRDPLTPLEETLDALDACVRAGKVRYLGLCNLAAWEIAKALGISAQRAFARFQSVQAYYSLAGRDLEREIVPLAKDQRLAILPWSPLAGGILSGKFTREGNGPAGARRATFDFPPVDRERAFRVIDAMRPIAQAHAVSVARVALAWLLRQSAVTSVIIGARTQAQLIDNLGAADLLLTAEEMTALDTASALPPEYPGWMFELQTADRGAVIK
jgi:aryl-alcohol dehydrogenase-like predicted oxidoreductase